MAPLKKGTPEHDEWRRKLSEAHTGKVMSDDARKNMSIARTGHTGYMKGKKHSEETKKKISAANTGKTFKMSPEARAHLSEIRKGKPGHPQTPEWIEKSASKRRGQKRGPFPPGHGEKISKALKGKPKVPFSEEHIANLSKSHMGKQWDMETRIKLSCTTRGISREEFDGFIQYEPYCPKFNDEFKERVRAFFGRACLLCGKLESESVRKLSVHHILFDKNTCCNDSIPLFAPLCGACHNKIRDVNSVYNQQLIDKINSEYGGKCYLPKGIL